jgi:hypothetical protein
LMVLKRTLLWGILDFSLSINFIRGDIQGGSLVDICMFVEVNIYPLNLRSCSRDC